MAAAPEALTAELLRAWDDSGCDDDCAAEVLQSLVQGRTRSRVVEPSAAAAEAAAASAGCGGAGGSRAGRRSPLCIRQRAALVAALLAAAAACCLRERVGGYLASQRCLVSNNVVLMELTRPAVDCGLCSRLNGSVPSVEERPSADAFARAHAYTGVPLLVRGGARDWSALRVFSFDYFKRLYVDTPGAIASIDRECQFFPYQTEFASMADVFNMSSERQGLEPGQPRWYVGWSNCHPIIKEELRKHYKRPEFLPNDSDSSTQDWIFMGGFGGGAYLHIDYVKRPSWQAMISGSKTWTLVPSPECQRYCPPMNVTMEVGDILIIDTNMWYHRTYIHPGQISITIGSEYD